MDFPIPSLSEDAFIEALSTLMAQCAQSEEDYEMVLRNLSVTVAHVLSLGLRENQAFPEEVEAFLAHFCASLQACTWQILREYDAGEGDP